MLCCIVGIDYRVDLEHRVDQYNGYEIFGGAFELGPESRS